jgi:hypothetical protein
MNRIRFGVYTHVVLDKSYTKRSSVFQVTRLYAIIVYRTNRFLLNSRVSATIAVITLQTLTSSSNVHPASPLRLMPILAPSRTVALTCALSAPTGILHAEFDKRHQLVDLGIGYREVLLQASNLDVLLGDFSTKRLQLLLPSQTVFLRRLSVDRPAV